MNNADGGRAGRGENTESMHIREGEYTTEEGNDGVRYNGDRRTDSHRFSTARSKTVDDHADGSQRCGHAHQR